MSVIKELIRTEEDGTISFGNYELDTKSKLSDFEHDGDMYKVKTYNEITKLERNGMFVYESVPGTTVLNLNVEADGMSFKVEGPKDAQITVELEEDAPRSFIPQLSSPGAPELRVIITPGTVPCIACKGLDIVPLFSNCLAPTTVTAPVKDSFF